MRRPAARVIFLFLFAGVASLACRQRASGDRNPPSSEIPPSVVTYLDSLKQSEDSIVIKFFEGLIQSGPGAVLVHHLFFDTTLQRLADSVLPPDLKDSLRIFLQNPPPESLQAAYVMAVDSIWDALLHPPQPEQPQWDTLDYDKMITPDLLPFPYNILKRLGLLRFGKEVIRINNTSSACFRMNRDQYIPLRSTVGTVVSCVEYGVWWHKFSPQPGVYKRARYGILNVRETRLTILEVGTPEGVFTGCVENVKEGRGCEGWVRILDRWMVPRQHRPSPPPPLPPPLSEEKIFLTAYISPHGITWARRMPKMHPIAVFCATPAKLEGWIPGASCILFRKIQDGPAFALKDVAIYRYEAPPIFMETMDDTVDYAPGDPPVDELNLQWEIHLYRPPDTSDRVVHCSQIKQFRVPGGPTDATRSLECAALKDRP